MVRGERYDAPIIRSAAPQLHKPLLSSKVVSGCLHEGSMKTYTDADPVSFHRLAKISELVVRTNDCAKRNGVVARLNQGSALFPRQRLQE